MLCRHINYCQDGAESAQQEHATTGIHKAAAAQGLAGPSDATIH